MAEKRKLAAILAADVAGFTRLAGNDEDRTLARLRALRSDLVDPTVAIHHGRVFKRTGDGVLVEFRSTVDAVRCAIEVQSEMIDRNAGLPTERRIEFRIGIHVGDVLEEADGDLMGNCVNIAARLEGASQPGGICLSGDAYRNLQTRMDLAVSDLGPLKLKNVPSPVQAYSVELGDLRRIYATELSENLISFGNERPSIAVLPFQNMSSDPEQEYFADGLSEDIITALSRVHSLFVIARNSTFTFKGQSVSVKQVGRDLATRYVLEGSVRKSNRRIRVTAQLIEAETGRHIWADRYDRELDDIFDIQDEITRSVVASVQHQLVLFEGDIVNRDRLDLWSMLKKSLREFYKFDIQALEAGARLAEQAIQLEPRSALGHGYLSCALHNLALLRSGPTSQQEQNHARELAIMSVKLDQNNEFCHWQLGCVLAWFGEIEKSVASLHRALELNPNYAIAWGTLGSVLAIAGQAQKSIEASLIGIQSNPKDPSNFFRYTSLAEAYYMLDEFETALEWGKKSLDRQADWFRAYHWVVASLVRLGRTEEARGVVRAYQAAIPNGSMADAELYPQKSATHRANLLADLREAGL